MKFFLLTQGFLLVLAALAATPWIIGEVERRTTVDPHIIMAREIQQFPIRGVNVISVFQNPNDANHVLTIMHIPSYSEWAGKDRENLKRYVLQIVRGTEYQKVDIIIGWDYNVEAMRAQGIWKCTELSTTSCEWELANSPIKSNFIKWPKQGRP